MNRRILYVVFASIAIILIVGLFLVFVPAVQNEGGNSNNSASNVLPGTLNNASTFHNDAYSFRFQYPTDYFVNASDRRFVRLCGEQNQVPADSATCFTVTRNERGVSEFLSLVSSQTIVREAEKKLNEKTFHIKEVSFSNEEAGTVTYQENYRYDDGKYLYDIKTEPQQKKVSGSELEKALDTVAQSITVNSSFPDWISYKDTTKKFEIQYPSNWSVQSTSTDKKYSDLDVLFGSPTWEGEPDWQLHVYTQQATPTSLIADARLAASKIGSTVTEQTVHVQGVSATLLMITNKEKSAPAYEVVLKKDPNTYLLTGRDYYSKKFQDFYSSLSFL